MKNSERHFDQCSTETEVKKQRAKLAFKFHPDKNGGNDIAFKEMEKQRTEALKRIAVSEGKAENYYEELEAKLKSGSADFGSSILKVAQTLEKKIAEKHGDKPLSFNDLFKEVAQMINGPKKEKMIGTGPAPELKAGE